MDSRPVSTSVSIPALAWTIFATLASAQPTSQTGAAFPVVTVSTGQSLRINALNLGSRTSTATSSCSVTMRFLDAKGATLKESTVAVVSNKSAAADLTHDQAGSSNQIAVRAVLLFGYAGGAPPGPDVRQQYDCNIVSSVEVYDDTTGRTSLILTDWKPVPGPDPRPMAALAGFVFTFEVVS